MASRKALEPFQRTGRSHQRLLLGSVSVLAIMASGVVAEARSLTTSSSALAPTTAVMAAQQAAAAQASAAALQAQASLAQAAAAMRAAQAAQAAAAAAAQNAASSIPNGLGVNGLNPASGSGYAVGNSTVTDQTLWQNASGPTQTVDPKTGHVTVDITQTAPKAILNWQTFNVGRNTTLDFNQSTSSWTVLNRVTDPSANPTTILGQIHAAGGVYIINANGIIFGAGSQINVGSLIASDLDVGALGATRASRDQVFLNTGIGAATPSFSSTLALLGAQISGTNYQGGAIGGGVRVDAGASISTAVNPSSPGFVYLFGANVTNNGTIASPAGEVAMVTGQTITLTPAAYDAATLPSNVLTTAGFRGTGFEIQQYASTYGVPDLTNPAGWNWGSGFRSGTGVVTHGGLIETPQGTVVMIGDQINVGNLHDAAGNIVRDGSGKPIAGVISAPTSISRNSMVLLDAVTSVAMNGVISIPAYEDGETLSSAAATTSGSTVQSFTPAFVEMSGQLSVTLGAGALVSAPSASVALNAVGNNTGFYPKPVNGTQTITPSQAGVQSIVLAGPGTVDGVAAAGAVIDVAGLQDVQLPASYNIIAIQPRGIDFADEPLQRSGALYGQTLYIDIRLSGKRSDGSTWCGTPVANACGYVDAVPKSIDQLMTTGGTVSFKTDLSNTDAGTQKPSVTAVTLQHGSVINTAGGYEEFLPGTVPTTWLLGADGHLYNIASASPDIIYTGIAGQNTISQAHFGINQTSTSLTQTYDSGYLQGSAAGGVSITSVQPTLQGTLLFGAITGTQQIAAGIAPSQGTLSITTPSSVVIGPAGSVSANFTSTSAYTLTLPASEVSSWGLSGLSITANDFLLASGSTVNLAPGGSFSVAVGGAIDIAGTVSAASGKISLVTDYVGLVGSGKPLGDITFWFSAPTTPLGKADVFVEGALDVSGRWVNDYGQTGAGAFGPGFINGGSIAIATDNNSSGNLVDTTGSILLAAGSLLDASGGGYISPKGVVQAAANGVLAGSGGSISLALYQGHSWGGVSGGGSQASVPYNPDAVGSTPSVIQLGGTLRAYGFQNNGTLTLAEPGTIQIGGQPVGGQPAGGGFYVPASLLAGGFGAYVFESAPDGYFTTVNGNPVVNNVDSITVAAGTVLTLRQQNLSSSADYFNLPTGTKIGAVAPLTTLTDDLRAPVNLTLASNAITLGAGAAIVTDAKAAVVLEGTPSIGTSTASAAADVLLLGDIVDHGGTVSIHATQTWLGSNAVIDLSGSVIHNSLFGVGGTYSGTSDTLLAGGTFSVDGNGGVPGAPVYLVAEQGAVVDISGISATIQAAASTRHGVTSVAMWSDAGTVSANVNSFLWGGTFVAEGGRSPITGQANPFANAGTLLLGGSNITLRQTTPTDLIDGLSAASPASAGGVSAAIGQLATTTSYTGEILAAVDRLGAFSNVFLFSTQSTTAGHVFTDLTDTTYGQAQAQFLNLTVSGNLTWNVADRLEIAAASIVLDGNTPDSAVVLSAPYVSFTGGLTVNSNAVVVPTVPTSAPSGSQSVIAVDAMNIDIEGAAFSNFAQAYLGGAQGAAIRSGTQTVGIRNYTTADIRLSTPKVSNGVVTTTSAGSTAVNPTSFQGYLGTGNDLTLSAQRIYPVSDVNFTITSPGNVTFSAPTSGATPATPLSAGGSLTVVAPNIYQNGNLFAPLGTITLGGTGTQSVTLGAGSITSVSLAGTLVPYGNTQDGTNWYYNSTLAPLAQLPGKALVLSGSNITVAAQSTVNLSGGGDVQASEFVPGTGGSTDTLATRSGGPTVYAILPSTNNAIAAFDVGFTAAQSATQGGDPYPLAGTQITIAGGNGIPAGTYTLYPGHYATLPGALRVVDYGSNLGVNYASGTTLTNGTVLVTGYYTQSTQPGTRSSGTELFAVQTGAVWGQYSKYILTSGNSYFESKGQQSGSTAAPPPLPIDAGRLAVVAQAQLVLQGTILAQSGVDASGNVGRGGELDVAGNQIAVVNGAASAPSGYVGVDVNQLDKLNLESILIGGLRVDQGNGTTLITPTATSVVVDTGDVAITAPEILLVAGATTQSQTIAQNVTIGGTQYTTSFQVTNASATPGTGSVTIRSGSKIDTTGGVQSTYTRHYVYADSSAGPATAQSIAAALGGTLDSTGTVINGANVLNFFTAASGFGPAYTSNNFQLAQGGVGALFVASSDSNVSVVGPAASPALTINFANIGTGSRATPVSGQVTLPGSSSSAGTVAIEAGASISTNTLSIQATAASNAIALNAAPAKGGNPPAAVIHANQVNLTAQSIGLGGTSTAPASGALVVSADTLANQLSSIQGLTLKTFGGNITFYDGATFGKSLQRLTLDAPALVGNGSGDGASADINAPNATVTLVNSGLQGTGPAPATGGTFSIEAAAIDLGGGTQTITGFSQVAWSASNQIMLAGSGALNLVGSSAAPINLAITTPNIVVGSATVTGTGSAFKLTTAGNVTIARPVGAAANPGASSQIGGSFTLTAASIDDAGTIQAQAGTLSLEATTGNLTLESGAYIAAGGYAKTLGDVTTYVPGGTVSLQADAGNVVTGAGSVIDLSQPAGGPGYGGVLNVTATVGSANLQGQIQARSADPTHGGGISLNTGGAVALDPLADLLVAGGVTGIINIHTLAGNLELTAGHTLAANSITLTADDTTWGAAGNFGQVLISGKIQSGCGTGFCNGAAGGQVALYGANAVVLEKGAAIDASTSHADQLGGNVTLGIGWNAKGNIDLQSGSTINVAGGSAGGLSGGTVYLRAPLVTGTAFGQGSVQVAGLNSTVTGARTFDLEDYVTVSTEAGIGLSTLSWNGVIDPAKNPAFTTAVAQFVEGALVGQNGPGGSLISYGFSGAVTLLANAAGAGNLHGAQVNLLPGVELVNVNPAVNNGDITIASNWNLAAGTVINLQNGTTIPVPGQRQSSFQYYVPATPGSTNSSAVNFEYRYIANFGTAAQPQFQIEPGVLTLVAGGNININASVSDGFFTFGNYTSSSYVTQVNSYLNTLSSRRGVDGTNNGTSYLWYLNSYTYNSLGQTLSVPIAPYDATATQANSANPTAAELADADLFPHLLNVCTNCNGPNPASPPTVSNPNIVQVTNPGSWSYTFTAGAMERFTNGAVAISANPNALASLTSIQSGPFAGRGNVVVSATPATYSQSLYSRNTATVTLPVMVRTGTGNIAVSAAQDINLTDQLAPSAPPAVIYAAGVNAALPPSVSYSLNANNNVVVSDPSGSGFFAPQVLGYDSNSANPSGFVTVFGPPTAAAFPQQGGNVTLVAQRDIVSTDNVTETISGKTFAAYQYYLPWLLADVSTTQNATAGVVGAGVFAPSGTQIASQSAWWIQYGSFQQGILSAGGNVSVTAGRDLIDVSVSLPTTGYTRGGLTSTSTPVTTVLGSGNMTVRAGRNILGGSFYEGSGTATIVAGGSVGPNGYLTLNSGTLQDLPVLAVDTGRIALLAAGSVSIGGVVNPAELSGQAPSATNPSGNGLPLFMDTYGPNSAASVTSLAGDINIANSPSSTIYRQFTSNKPIATEYPASFSAIALGGDITTVGLNGQNTGAGSLQNPGITLAGSPNGTFTLLAQGNIDLTGGLPATTTQNGQTVPTGLAEFPTFSTGPSLLDAGFDPYQPANGETGSSSKAVLAQQTGASTARIYAVTGSITGAGQIMINRPADIRAGLDIIDLNLAVENISAGDVSSITAGRDITYSGNFNFGGLQVAGPGFLVVQAGRNLGPFLPGSADTTSAALVQEGIVSDGNAGVAVVAGYTGTSGIPVFNTMPVGNLYRFGSPGLYDAALLGPYFQPGSITIVNSTKNRNALLPTTGADIIAQFGVGKGIDYQAVIDTYIDPANAANVAHNYISELTTFMCTTGALNCAGGAPGAAAVFTAFQNLGSGRQALQDVFVDQVFTAELKNVATGNSIYQYYQSNGGPYAKAALLDAYIMINTLFPAAYGYTNDLGGSVQTVGAALAGALAKPNGAGKYAVNVLSLVKSVDLSGAAGNFTKEVPVLVRTGNLDLLHATVQTDLGGNISILGPGGNVNVGSTDVEPNANLKLNNIGILTLSGGGINTFTDGSVLVNTSRIFTEQGGDVAMWSSNADLNAGVAAKTTTSQPPLEAFFNVDDQQIVNPAGLVTGGGIGVLQTTSSSAASNLDLQAPRGIIDFGSAGVRASGNLIVVAPAIVNASNAGVGGAQIGVSTVSVPNIGGITAASNVAGASNKNTELPTGSTSPTSQPSVFVVEVLGYGGSEDQSGCTPRDQNKPDQTNQNQDQKKNNCS